jgi:hypothetical protein
MDNMKILTKDPLYQRWTNMIRRCHDSKDKQYEWYGGRGIIVCERWRLSFLDFLRDTGFPSFKGAQIDRIKNDGNYEPGNVQWVTCSRNCRNRKSSKFITYNGETMCLADWADKLGLKRKSLMSRINMGWPIEEILVEGKRHRFRKEYKRQEDF